MRIDHIEIDVLECVETATAARMWNLHARTVDKVYERLSGRVDVLVRRAFPYRGVLVDDAVTVLQKEAK